MSTAFADLVEPQFLRALRRLQNQAAVVRALVHELDCVTPATGAGPGDSRRLLVLGAQLAEEFGRLACQMLECAAAASDSHAS
jgi:hypothetical protein